MTPTDAASGETWAVLPAAGVGSRMGGGAGDPAKQHWLLGGQPVWIRTLQALAPEVDGMVVAVAEHEQDAVRQRLRESPLADLAIHVTAGGATRQASVARGVEAVPASGEVVIVHDAVRPFVPAERVRAVVDAVRASGAAALAVPVADTLRRGAGGRFSETVDREGLWRMQTPQGARREVLQRALAMAEARGLAATDEAGVLQAAGVDVALVEGDERNLKLTRPADWRLAQALWAQREA